MSLCNNLAKHYNLHDRLSCSHLQLKGVHFSWNCELGLISRGENYRSSAMVTRTRVPRVLPRRNLKHAFDLRKLKCIFIAFIDSQPPSTCDLTRSPPHYGSSLTSDLCQCTLPSLTCKFRLGLGSHSANSPHKKGRKRRMVYLYRRQQLMAGENTARLTPSPNQ